MIPAEAILEGLDPEQRLVATHLEGPVVVLAGAGTGKTRAMTHRIAYGVATGVMKPHEVLALTFTAKAAGEMRGRLRGLGAGNVQARTFHSAALRQLQYFWPRVFGGAFPELQGQKAPLVAAALTQLQLPADRDAVRDCASEIEWSKVRMLTPERYVELAAARALPEGIDAESMRALLTGYESQKTERFAIDFEDVLLLTAGMLQAHPEVAAEVHSQYRHFVVDEFQDVSLLQHTVLDLWLGQRRSLCVVGDASQTIYSFAGASPGYLLDFPRQFPEAAQIRLVRDYRSTPQIVDLANRVLEYGKIPGRLELISARDPGPKPTFREYPDDAAEAEAIAADIAEEVAAGRRPQDIAVLFRTNGQSQAFESALSQRGISYVLRGGERFFARKEVREAIALLRGAARAETEARALGDTVAEILGSLGWSRRPPQGTGAVRERWESLQAIVDVAVELQSHTELPVRLAELVADLDDRADHQNAPALAGVTLASLHAAKGLEWASVYIAGTGEGLLPIAYADTDESLAEERRLFYVGITRAQTRLSISWALARAAGGRAQRTPSRFVTELRAETSRRGRRARPAQVSAPVVAARETHCRVCGKPLRRRSEQTIGRCAACPSDARPEMLEALGAWRADAASRAGVPEFMVLTQDTLAAVAERMPRTLRELEAVPGIGPAKLGSYGEDIVAVVAGSLGADRSVG